MYLSDFEDLGKNQIERTDFVVDEVARVIINKEVTDDNPSRSSGRTTLEELISYWSGAESHKEIKEIKLKAKGRAKDLSGGYYMPLQRDVSNTKDSLLMQESVLSRIAKLIIFEYISDDNPSPENNFTSVDQIIILCTGIENRVEIEEFKKRVYKRIEDLKGGANFSEEEPLIL